MTLTKSHTKSKTKQSLFAPSQTRDLAGRRDRMYARRTCSVRIPARCTALRTCSKKEGPHPLAYTAHWLGYDELAEGAGITRDAADAAVAELVARVRNARSTVG